MIIIILLRNTLTLEILLTLVSIQICIGPTKNYLKIRLQHYKQRNSKSALSKHLQESGYSFDRNNTKMLVRL